MRRPKLNEFDDGDGNGPDFEAYTERMGDYEDAERDRQLEEQWTREEEDIGDQIHEQRRDEKDEK